MLVLRPRQKGATNTAQLYSVACLADLAELQKYISEASPPTFITKHKHTRAIPPRLTNSPSINSTMPSVGPEIPSHLAKRKRSIDEAEDPKSPPRKVLAATAPTVGPTLPPSKNPDELDVDDSSEDDYGPSLGPSKPTTKAASPPSKRVLGPAPPAAVGPSLPPSKNPDELDIESDSEDDGYGPAAPATKPASAAAQQIGRAHV